LSESLRRELLCYEIDVIVIAPGAVATAIWGKVEQIDVAPYVNTPYAPALERLCAYMVALGKGGLPPERLGQAVMHALTTTRPKVRYAITPQPIQDWLGRNRYRSKFPGKGGSQGLENVIQAGDGRSPP
jgi:short-subunit dehydrogenase